MCCGLLGSSCEILGMLNYRADPVLTTYPGKLEKILVDARNSLSGSKCASRLVTGNVY